MIILDVEDYCHACPDFNPDVRKTDIDAFGGDSRIETAVFCKYERRCSAVARFLRKEFDKCAHSEK